MSLANKVTLLRIFLVFPFVVCLLVNTYPYRLAALIIFLIGAVTDYYDGIIARRTKQITDLGKFLDPLADKLFVSSALIIMVQMKDAHVPAWAVVLIIFREFIINGLRTYAASRGEIIAASYTGKIKTVIQMSVIFLSLFLITIEKYEAAITYAVIIAALFSLYSGFDYLKKNKILLTEVKGQEEQ